MKIERTEVAGRRFAVVQVRNVLVRDLVLAEQGAGANNNLRFFTTLLAQVATFDGERLPPEEIEEMHAPDFLRLAGEFANLSELTNSLDGGSLPSLSPAERVGTALASST